MSQQNGVPKRHNQTLLDMAMCMISDLSLLEFLKAKAIKIAIYILNRVPTKAIILTIFEFWIGKKPSLNHVHIQGCLAKARLYNLNESKLYPRTIDYFFISYPEQF